MTIEGTKFGRLTALRLEAKKRGQAYWLCSCECGGSKVANIHALTAGKTRSCGCLRTELLVSRSQKHGAASRADRSPEWKAWCAMKRRCYGTNAVQYMDYGGRGISVCDAWRDDFEAFLADMGKKPSPEYSLDRIDNNGNYEPGNCRWATFKTQSRNKRNSRKYDIHGEHFTAAEMSERYGVNVNTIKNRIRRGVTPTEACHAG